MGREERAVGLLVIPGLGLDTRSWAPTLRHLRVPSEVVLLPGYGLPARRGAPLSPSALADTVLTGLAGLAGLGGAGPVVLAGHSSGCQVAAHVARREPGSVRRLVLVGPTTDPEAVTWHRLAARWLRTAGHEDPRQVPELVRQYAATGLASMARGMDAARRDRIEESLAGVRCPVVVLRGPADRICPQDWAASLGASRTLPAGGHMVPWTHGRAVADHLRDLLEDGGTTPGGSRL